MTPYFNLSVDDQTAIAIGGQHVHLPDSSAHLGGHCDYLSAIIQKGEMRRIESHLTQQAAVERAAYLAFELRCAIPDMTVREYYAIQKRGNATDAAADGRGGVEPSRDGDPGSNRAADGAGNRVNQARDAGAVRKTRGRGRSISTRRADSETLLKTSQ